MCKSGSLTLPALSIMNKAVVLLSGGLDSSTTLFSAKAQGWQCHCLVFDYNQRHKKEIVRAKAVARAAHCPCTVVKIAMPWKGSSLLDSAMKLPQGGKLNAKNIPSTYVPARNIIFLSFAASFAEALAAKKIFIGANAVDYSGYPDCRPSFFKAYEQVLAKGLKTGVEGHRLKVETPLIHLTKAQIVRLAITLKVPLRLTWSCYSGGSKPCGVCDSCRLRIKGFKEAKCVDPAV